MKPEEAIKMLKYNSNVIHKTINGEIDINEVEALDMAITALGAIDQIRWERDMAIKQLHDLGYGLGEKPRNEDVPGTNDGDTISRRAAIDAVHKNYDAILDFKSDGLTVAYSFEDIINDLPSAQPDHTADISKKVSNSCGHENDPISRRAAIDAALSFTVEYCGAAFDENMQIGLKQCLDGLPSVQPEIVRCKDCKYYSPMNRETKTGICNLTMHQNFGDNWFCAAAERKTDD